MLKKILPVLVALTALLTAAAPASAAPSSGVDDWRCRPSAAHPRPVVLLHGMTGNRDTWAFGAPRIAAAGHCVFTTTYGRTPGGPGLGLGGFAPITESSLEIASFVDAVLAATGSTQVDLVGHSEGGFQALYVTKVLGYAPKVGTVVGLAPSTDLASTLPLLELAGGCPACHEMVRGGAAWTPLHDGPITVPGVRYSMIATRLDLIAVPAGPASFIREPGVRNQFIQDTCPLDPVGHMSVVHDSSAIDLAVDALDPGAGHRVRCGLGLPV
ncbi:triacylglycerol esterase/lipase EstA (alpha/beta hydrolase family) [Crossiella equi]|uniref:Triacylglycerol esterase/lipase EstA (Alpha/beta hydrolase family) n=1 Tax=Crossiella equi TaxID=130796 RepID=A0ABS5AIB4_9PSEU|nr:alpha/beta fold hydrolase [Crossiella equi]MBP2476317.1 triacylglycerol esterase/lipase EstA (alpha/beta hydrolase family) [Crossiella equi]